METVGKLIFYVRVLSLAIPVARLSPDTHESTGFNVSVPDTADEHRLIGWYKAAETDTSVL